MIKCKKLPKHRQLHLTTSTRQWQKVRIMFTCSHSYSPKFGTVDVILIIHNVSTDDVAVTDESTLNYFAVRRFIYPPDNTRLVHTSQNVHLEAAEYTKRRSMHTD